MQIISKNSKTGYSVNFPIEQTCDKSCPFYQNRSCYGLKGRFLFGVVKAANEARFNLYKENPLEYFSMLRSELAKIRTKTNFVRINGIGDTPDARWSTMFSMMARDYPEMQFWVATRKKFWAYAPKSENITVRYSDGVDGDLTSNVTSDESKVTCPATVKGSGIHTCSEKCGYKCWSKDVPHVSYLKH